MAGRSVEKMVQAKFNELIELENSFRKEIVRINDEIDRIMDKPYYPTQDRDIDSCNDLLNDTEQQLNHVQDEISNLLDEFGYCIDVDNWSLQEQTTLCEMAMSRQDAIDRCMSLGQKFIEHFKKIYEEENKKCDAINHWVNEMQSWYNQVSKIKLKPKSTSIQLNNLMDWFFTVGSEPEEYLDYNDDMCSKYNKFILSLCSGGDVKGALVSILDERLG